MSRRKQKVSIYIRIRKPDGGQPYCPAVWLNKKALKPNWCLVDGAEEHHPEDTYYLRYRVNGKQVWEHAGDNPDEVVRLRLGRIEQLANPNLSATKRLFEQHKSEPVEQQDRFRLTDEVAIYLRNCEKLRPKTHQAYKLSLELFQQSFNKTFVDQVRKQDLQAFDTFLLKDGNDDRTRSNRVSHIVTFLRNKEGRRQGDPIPNVSITVKYVEAPPESYTRQELEDLFRVSCDEDKMLWRFFLGNGFRDEEVAVAEYSDINPQTKMISVVEKPYFEFKPKDCEKRSVPVSDELIAYLKARKNGNNLIFPSPSSGVDGHLLRRLKNAAYKGGLNCGRCIGTIAGTLVSCAKAAVCEKWILHRFRKNFATDRHEAGASPRKIQKWLGHSSLETTLLYLAHTDDTTDSVRDIVNSTHVGL
ncbi:MAG: site-specific integrase [Candidatus Sulfotelmatobacter sp.]